MRRVTTVSGSAVTVSTVKEFLCVYTQTNNTNQVNSCATKPSNPMKCPVKIIALLWIPIFRVL